MYAVTNAPSMTAELISIVSNVRCLLHSHVYPYQENIDILHNIIKDNIPSLMTNYNHEKKEFTIKIMKTSLKKYEGFEHRATFYYKIVNKILVEYLSSIKSIILPMMQSMYGNIYMDVYNFLISGACINLCNVECFGDNIIIIHI